MEGRMFIKEKRLKREDIISLAKNVITCVNVEKAGNSKWKEYQLALVEKEMLELIRAVEQGKRIKHSKKRMLDSTYLLTDSIGLSSTNLGKNIQIVQNAIRKKYIKHKCFWMLG